MLGPPQLSAGQGLAAASLSHPQHQPRPCRQGKGGGEGKKEGGKKRGREGGRGDWVGANDGAPIIITAGGILACAGGDGVVRLVDTSGTKVRSGQRSGVR